MMENDNAHIPSWSESFRNYTAHSNGKELLAQSILKRGSLTILRQLLESHGIRLRETEQMNAQIYAPDLSTLAQYLSFGFRRAYHDYWENLPWITQTLAPHTYTNKDHLVCIDTREVLLELSASLSFSLVPQQRRSASRNFSPTSSRDEIGE